MSFVVDVNSVSDMEVRGANRRESSSTNTQAQTIYEKLTKAAEYGDIETLYQLITEDPTILCHFDKVPFCETPLHIAAEKGKTHFAMELMTLKPSLASKLNGSGFSPVHLALQNNHTKMVRWFVAFDSSLIRVKGRGRITPLHHVAEIDDAELLSEFLFYCPSSVDDLTITGETAVHVAVRNQKLKAFKVLLGWLKRVNKKEILDLKDEDGNTVFHIAALLNQTEVIKLLRKTVKVNAKNLAGKTADDILQSDQPPCSTMTPAEYLSKSISFMEKRNNLLGLSNLSLTRERSVNTSNRRDAILVVAILLVTATYQAGLSPPGGFYQEIVEQNLTKNVRGHLAGQMTMSFYKALFFIILNGFAFLLSLFVIITLIVGLPMWKLIYWATAALTTAMLASNITIFPDPPHHGKGSIAKLLFILGLPLSIGGMLLLIFRAFIDHKNRRNKVDFPASCFRRSDPHTVSYLLLNCLIVIPFLIFFGLPEL